MGRLSLLLCAAALLASQPCAHAAGAAAPLLTRNQYAPLLAFYDPPPLPATPPRKWRFAVSLDYASLFETEGDDRTGGVVDMEIGRLALYAGWRAGRRLAVDLEIPFIWTGGGFLDDFVSDWHSTFGLPNGDRDQAASNRHVYRLVRDGEVIIDSDEGGTGLGDVAATLTLLVTGPGAPITTAVRVGVKSPTGGTDLSLHGSGGWDYAVGVVAETRRAPWSAALHLAAIYPTGVSEVQVDPFATGLLSLAWSGVEGLDLLAELAGRTSPFDTGVEIFDAPAVELRLGVRKALGRGAAIEAAFVEDVTHSTTPDFTIHLAWRLTPGG